MYDMDNDGVISKNELVAFLTLMVGSNVSQGRQQTTSEIIDVDGRSDDESKQY
jgi:Ca2+-binding EF-hand superfamily protein